MPAWPPWHTRTRESANSSVGEHDLQLAEHQIPVLVSGVPVLRDTLGGQIQHPAQRVVVREGRLVLCDLPELAVQALDEGLSQILCKHRNAVQIEQNLFKAEVAQAAARPPKILCNRRSSTV